jgi:hypothetical protein
MKGFLATACIAAGFSGRRMRNSQIRPQHHCPDPGKTRSGRGGPGASRASCGSVGSGSGLSPLFEVCDGIEDLQAYISNVRFLM